MLHKDINKRIISINLLPVVVCNANTKRKVHKLIRDKISIDAVDFFFYIGYSFRDINNKDIYYSSCELKQMILNYFSSINLN